MFIKPAYVYFIMLLAVVMLPMPAVCAETQTWDEIEKKAQGQTIYFATWGGSPSVNRTITWAAAEVKKRYGITLRHVKLANTADGVARILAENTAGRVTQGGSIDIIWINGENFLALKEANVLYNGAWASMMPYFSLIDTQKPIETDFSIPVDGLEIPWGIAQFSFVGMPALSHTVPRSSQDFFQTAQRFPRRLSYPHPSDFIGMTFLKQILWELSPDTTLFSRQVPVSPADYEKIVAPLWSYLDTLHPFLWREGKTFPPTAQAMQTMAADGELFLFMTFTPGEIQGLIDQKKLPTNSFLFGFDKGMIANAHFLAIPRNARSAEAAKVVINFLLSPQAQQYKSTAAIWGDGSVLRADALHDHPIEPVGTLSVPSLPEFHGSWVKVLEKEWVRRYGSQ